MKRSPSYSISLVRTALILLVSTVGLAAHSKSTVCSMTLNSTDEIEIIKKRLGTTEYDYVELDANAAQACGKAIKCDIFVVSGHFGGNFFGTKAGTKLEVGLETLEELSCSNKCGNVFSQAKQVYLFGCNTLNGKQKDSRTPEQYVNVLRADGYGMADAQRLASNIYSPLGGTYSQRMQNLFPNATQIFGFYSLAPSGKNIRRELDAAFESLGDMSYVQTLTAGSSEANTLQENFVSRLKRFSFTATTGKPQSDSLICKIVSQPRHYEKLKAVREIVESGQGMKVITYLVKVFNSLPLDQFDSRELAQLEKIKSNAKAKDEILKFVESSSHAFASVRFEILEMMGRIGWITASEAQRIGTAIATDIIPRVFKDYAYLSVLGPAAVNTAKIDFSRLPSEYWDDVRMFQIVERFNARDKFVIAKLMQVLETTQNPAIAQAAGLSILRIEKWENIQSEIDLAAKFLSRFNQPEIATIVQQLKETQRQANL